MARRPGHEKLVSAVIDPAHPDSSSDGPEGGTPVPSPTSTAPSPSLRHGRSHGCGRRSPQGSSPLPGAVGARVRGRGGALAFAAATEATRRAAAARRGLEDQRFGVSTGGSTIFGFLDLGSRPAGPSKPIWGVVAAVAVHAAFLLARELRAACRVRGGRPGRALSGAPSPSPRSPARPAAGRAPRRATSSRRRVSGTGRRGAHHEPSRRSTSLAACQRSRVS
jgi:hypothetical protein